MVKRPYAILLFVILTSTLMQGLMAATKTSITHDETISYLSAVGKQGEFERIFQSNESPANHWVTASEWKRWFAIDAPFAFRQIGLDLAESDVHPPLYFWALHIWTLLFGVHAWTGPTLNIVFQAVGALGLFALGYRSLKNHFESLAVVFIWLFSPASLTMALEARQYSLFGVCAIYFVWLIAVATDQTRSLRWPIWLLLAIVTAAGALTHYHFALVVGVAALVYLLKLVRVDFRRVLFVGTAVAAGYGLFFGLHPQFFQSVQELGKRQALEAEFLSGSIEFLQRIYLVGKTFTGYWTLFGVLQVALFCLMVASLIWVGMVLVRNPGRLKAAWRNNNFAGYEAGLFFIGLASLLIVLYLTYFSPLHSMTDRHMSAVWPFYPFLAILLLRLVNQVKRVRLTLLLGTAVLFSSLFMVGQRVTAVSEPAWDDLAYLEQHEKFVVDGVYQGILPRIIFQLPDDALVYVATQNELLARSEAWLPMLGEDSVYISELSYENTKANRDQILALITQNFQLVDSSVKIPPVGQPYFLKLRE